MIAERSRVTLRLILASALLLAAASPSHAASRTGSATPEVVTSARTLHGHVIESLVATGAQAGPDARPQPTSQLSLKHTNGSRSAPDAASPIGPLVGVSHSGGVVSVGSFVGIGQCDYTCNEPPDPWIAVSPTHVVQAVNTNIRISSRSGGTLLTVPMGDLFDVEPAQAVQADPRIIWDDGHDRWVGTMLSFDCSAGHLYLAVSMGPDPTAGWITYTADYPGALPDYPGLGGSTDKLALSANLFSLVPSGGGCTIGSFVAGDLLALDWSAVGDLSIDIAEWSSSSLFTFRPAVAHGSGADVHVVMQVLDSVSGVLDVGYVKISGSVAGGTISVGPIRDLTSLGLAASFLDPPIPHGATEFGPGSVDGRPTDAIWMSNRLWFVSTYPCHPGGDPTLRACVRVIALNTSTSVPGVPQDFLIGTAGMDSFMGGVGLAQDATLFVVYSASSTSGPIGTWATAQRPTDPSESYWKPKLIRAGSATYDGSRWGDYVGVAQDPVDVHAVWQGNQYPDGAGQWATRISTLYAYFIDIGFTIFDADIMWLFNAGITKGCSADRFCPDTAVTRGQMAAFLARALDLPAASSDFFTDDETSIFEADINRLAAAGITSGCGSGKYCPEQTITREQMAAFLDRALDLPATGTDFFTDDGASLFQASINRIAAAGITTGCTPTTYCPLLTVTRGQMAAFLHRAL